MPIGLPGPTVRRTGRVLQEQLRSRCLVDERVDVLDSALTDPGVARALVRDTGTPDLGRVDGDEELVRVGKRDGRRIEELDPLVALGDDLPAVDAASLDAIRPLDADVPHQ